MVYLITVGEIQGNIFVVKADSPKVVEERLKIIEPCVIRRFLTDSEIQVLKMTDFALLKV